MLRASAKAIGRFVQPFHAQQAVYDIRRPVAPFLSDLEQPGLGRRPAWRSESFRWAQGGLGNHAAALGPQDEAEPQEERVSTSSSNVSAGMLRLCASA